MSRRSEPLSRARVIDAALAIIDEHGVDALTMRRLGAKLRADPMAVYRHFANKTAILDALADTLWERGLDVARPSDDQHWTALLAESMLNFRRVLLAHPNVVAVVATHAWRSEEQLDLLERALAALHRAGMPVDDSTLGLLQVVGVFTTGFVLAEAVPLGQPEYSVSDIRENSEGRNHLQRALTGAPESSLIFARGLHALIQEWNAPTEHPLRDLQRE